MLFPLLSLPLPPLMWLGRDKCDEDDGRVFLLEIFLDNEFEVGAEDRSVPSLPLLRLDERSLCWS